MAKLFRNLSEKEYRSYPLESYSSLKLLLSSPEAFLKAKENPFLGNDFTLLGTAVHLLIQDMPDLVKFDPYTKKETDHPELVVLPESFKEKLNEIRKNIPLEIHSIILDSQTEIELPVKAEFKNLKYKGKLDIVYMKHMVGEIKTSSKATDLKTFRKEAYSRDYDLQAAMYCHALKLKKHFFIVVNTLPPYNVAYYDTSDHFLKSGFLKLEKVAKEYKKLMGGGSDDDKKV